MPQNFVTLSFQCQRELAEKFRKKYPQYGDTSKVLRQLLKMCLDGKVAILIQK